MYLWGFIFINSRFYLWTWNKIFLYFTFTIISIKLWIRKNFFHLKTSKWIFILSLNDYKNCILKMILKLNYWDEYKRLKNKSFEFKFIYLPLFDKKLSFWMSCVLNGSVLTSDVLSIVIVTDWKFTIWFLFIWVINNTNITTSKRWSSFRITGNSKLSKV